MKVFAAKPLLNIVLEKYFNNILLLPVKISGNILNSSVELEIINPPKITLLHKKAPNDPNVQLDFDVVHIVIIVLGNKILDQIFPAVATANIVSLNGTLSLDIIDVKINNLIHLPQNIINIIIGFLPQIHNFLKAIPLPTLNLFDPNLKIDIESIDVIDQFGAITMIPILVVRSQLSNDINLSSASDPNVKQVMTLLYTNPISNYGRILGFVSESAVNYLIKNKINQPIEGSIDSRNKKDKTEVWVTGNYNIFSPEVNIKHSICKVDVDFSLTNLKFGIEINGRNVLVLNLNKIDGDAEVNVDLSSNGNKSIIVIRRVRDIDLNIRWDDYVRNMFFIALLKDIQNILESKLTKIANNALSGKNFEIFNLAANQTIGSNINVNLTLEQLDFYDNSVMAMIRVT